MDRTFWILVYVLMINTNVYASINNITICEHNSVTINCSHGYIRILSASYGRHNNDTCPSVSINTTNCHAPETLEILQDQCDNIPRCYIYAGNDEFGGDPCKHTYKYLNATYTCGIEGQTTSVIVTGRSSVDFPESGSESTSISTESTEIITEQTTYLYNDGRIKADESSKDGVIVIIMPTLAVVMVLIILIALLFLRKRGKLKFCRDLKKSGRSFANAAYENGTHINGSVRSEPAISAKPSVHVYYNDLQSGNEARYEVIDRKNKNKNIYDVVSSNTEKISKSSHNRYNQYDLAQPISDNLSSYENETTDDMEYMETTPGQYDYFDGNDLRRNRSNNEHLYDHTVNTPNPKDDTYDKTFNIKTETDPVGVYSHTNIKNC